MPSCSDGTASRRSPHPPREDPEAVVDPLKRRLCDDRGAFSSVGQHHVEALRGVYPPKCGLADRREERDDHLGEVRLEVPVPLARVLVDKLVDRRAERAEWMVRRLEIPGFDAGSKRMSRSVSVTAERIRLATTAGSSSISMIPWGLPDFDIFEVGSCRS